MSISRKRGKPMRNRATALALLLGIAFGSAATGGAEEGKVEKAESVA